MGQNSSSQTSTTHAVTDTQPWKPTIPVLGNVINDVGYLTPNNGSEITPRENGAFNSMFANADAGNPYAPRINAFATSMLNGTGFGPDQTQYLGDMYRASRDSLLPVANQSTDPYSHPAFQNLVNTLTGDITNNVKSQYAGAGYSPSATGDFAQQLARGLGQGIAPTFLQAQDALTAQRSNAANSLLNAGNTATNTFWNMDQNILNDQMQGVPLTTAGLNANDSAAIRQLQIAQQQRNLPLGDLGNIESLIVPMAQLGGTTTQDSTTNTQGHQNASPLSMLGSIGSLFSGGSNSAMSGFGGLGLGLLGMF